MAATFTHPTLGELLPKLGDGVEQFLGLKYASLENRFSPPKLHRKGSEGAIDATKFGPSVISPPTGCDLEFGFIQQSLPKPVFKSSELDGLNLNVTVPAHISRGQRIPVLVFLHGGGFFLGGNSWPQYNFAKLVKLSYDLGLPIIGVNINYRLGVFGFLTSEELRNAGYLGNNGLRDQRVSFEWIKEHIAGFGGDPDNITVMGESAGGVSTTLHFYAEKPLFSRAISLGGTSLLMKPLPPTIHEMNYQTILECLSITAISPEERVQALLDIPSDEILSKLPPGLPLFPVVDGDIVPSITSFDDVADHNSQTLPAKVWLKSLLIGNNQLDGSIFIDTMENREGHLVTNFIASIEKNLASFPGAAERVFKTYGICSSLTKEEGTHAVLLFATDIGFFLPSHTFAEGFLGKANVYYFNEPNPWEGRFKGFASHILDVAFLFQNYNHLLSPAQAKLARKFASDVIGFANGKAIWKTFSDVEKKAEVYGPSVGGGSEGKVTTIAARDVVASQRRSDIFQFRENPGLDNLSNAFGMFLAGQ